MVPDADPILSVIPHFIRNEYVLWSYLCFLTWYRITQHKDQNKRIQRLESLIIPKPMEYIQARFFEEGRVYPTRYIILHHLGTGTVDGAIAHFQTVGVKASAHYIVGNGRIIQMVNENDTAWTSNNNFIDRQAITIEVYDTEASNGLPAHPLTEADRLLVNNLVHDVAVRHNIPINRTYIKGHREVAIPSEPTSCPGNIDVDRIVSESAKIIMSLVGSRNVNPFPTISHFPPQVTVTPASQITNSMLMEAQFIQFDGDGTVWVVIGSFASAFQTEDDFKKAGGDFSKVIHLPAYAKFRPLPDIH